MQHTLIACGLAVLCSLCGGVALAQPQKERGAATPQLEQPRIVLVASPGMEELVVRFMAELRSLGLEVVRAPDTEAAASVSELEALAYEHDARVTVRVSRAGSAVDLWLVNPRSQELVYRRLAAAGDPAVVVLRSLELLRGALLELRAIGEEEPPPAPKAPPAVVVERPAPVTPAATPPFWIGVSGALVAAQVNDGLGGGAQLALRRRVGTRFALQGELFAPLHEWSQAGAGGTAKIWLGTANLAAIVTPWGEQTLTPGLGLGLGVLALHTRGEASAGFRGTSQLNAAAFPHGRVELGLTLSPRFRLRAALAAGFATPRPVLLFADQRQEDWLNPLLLSSLGVEIALR